LTIASLNERLSKLTADETTATQRGADSITIGKHALAREDVPSVLANKLDSLPVGVRDTTRVPIGTYRGLRFGLVLHPQFPPDVYLEGAITRQSGLSRDHQGPRAVLNALERLATGYGSECVRVRQDLAIAESQLRDYRERLGKPFPHDKYLGELTDLRDQLKAGLSATAYQAQDQEGPRTDELADSIKALKAANTIEAAPQRARQKKIAAEEPVTARIRRRQTEAGEAVRLSHAPRTEAANDNHHADNDNQPNGLVKPPSFRERIAQERQRQDQGPGLP
jgi:hypothetical protein